jgi:alpha-L-rhamnosidase
MRRLVTILSATIMLAFSGCAVSTGSDVAVKKLRCEYRVNPLGIDVVEPRLSWILESARCKVLTRFLWQAVKTS